MESIIVAYLREATVVVCYVSAPALLASVIVGFGVGFFQASTQIQEQTLAYIPKILAVFLTLLVCGQWMMGMIVRYSMKIMTDFNSILSGNTWI